MDSAPPPSTTRRVSALPRACMSAMGRGCVKTRSTCNFLGHRTPPAMPIADPGPFWKVDVAFDHAMNEFSHSLGRNHQSS